MKHESAVQAVKELMRKDSVFRSVIQGWGVATLLIGLFMFYMGANTYIQSYKQTDWVFGSAYITDISELNRSKVGRGGINYSMTYEYEVDGTHYTGKYGPLANSIEVGRSIRIKYDPSAPENSTYKCRIESLATQGPILQIFPITKSFTPSKTSSRRSVGHA